MVDQEPEIEKNQEISEKVAAENKKIEFTSQELEELMSKSLDDIINGTTNENQNDVDLGEEVPEK